MEMANKSNTSKYNKSDQIKVIADKLNEDDRIISNDSRISEIEAKEVYEVVIDSLSDMLVDLDVGEKLIIPSFLTITKDRRGAKMGRNPKKPEDEYLIDSYDTLSIKQSQILKNKIKNKK